MCEVGATINDLIMRQQPFSGSSCKDFSDCGSEDQVLCVDSASFKSTCIESLLQDQACVCVRLAATSERGSFNHLNSQELHWARMRVACCV